MILPTLYKKTKVGALQICDITILNDTFTVTWGQHGGKLQSKTTTCVGVNIGKKNATTGAEQAVSEAKSKHAKKIKSGYVLDPSGELQVKLPQKVKAYIGNEHKIDFPAYSTPKLNGINATYWLKEDGSLSLTSRGGEEYPAIPHLEPQILKVMEKLSTDCLNGELYIHGQHLQDITSAVKKPKELSKRLEFSIFEMPNYGCTYKQRNIILNRLCVTNEEFFDNEAPDISVLTGVVVNNADEIEDHYNICMKLGLEGTVIYNAIAPYEFNTRSSHVYKYKKTQDSEFKIIGLDIDKNGHPVFHCEVSTESDKLFKVKPKGTDSERKQIIEEFDELYLGKFYKVEYEVLSKDGVPLKPVGIGLRDCDNLGNPLV